MGSGGDEQIGALRQVREMHFQISHRMNYTYSQPVFIEPLAVRLRPRCNSMQRVEHFSLDVAPTPAGIGECIDLDGNNIATVWFDGLHDSLTISATSQVEVLPTDPFKYVVTEEKTLRLPVIYPQPYWSALEQYLRRQYGSSQVEHFVQPIAEESEGQTIPFLRNLTVVIYEQFERVFRETGDPMTPNETIAQHRGACRDLAVLFIECCRNVGLAARFVSGYAHEEVEDAFERRHMHAWVEAYLPGGGWRGFDPSLGLAVADRHVAVAASADPAYAAPTSGTFWGTGVESKIEYEVTVSCSSPSQSSIDDQPMVSGHLKSNQGYVNHDHCG